ncbi:MAG: aminodeoxychorismate synthase component I [Cocleimonas sp.]
METLSNLLSSDRTYALLDDSKSSKSRSKNLLFTNPQHEIIAQTEDELAAALEKIEEYKKQGLYLCGYLSYEAGYYFIDKNIPRKSTVDNQPLLYFIAFKDLHRANRDEVEACFNKADTYPESNLCLHNLQLNVEKPAYFKAIEKIKEYIRAGDTYQINYTLKYKFKLQGTASALYKALRKKQPVEFGALLHFPKAKIVSLSPELFIKKGGSTLTSKPMKGTAKRGETKEDDKAIVDFLKQDSKTLSENVMIVDLIRNDFGRVCKTGSVHVTNLFQVQTFKTLHQMISTVKGTLAKNLSFSELLHALFPCGSITGAPKIRTMEIINELEKEPRGIYTGAIGYLMPNDDFYFNVPIRTIVIDEYNRCEMGIGSGIIYESNAKAEYEECLLKGNFLTSLNKDFYLIEAFRFDAKKGAFINLDAHLKRLSQSAKSFGFTLNLATVKAELEKTKTTLQGLDQGLYKVRLTTYQDGAIKISHEPVRTESTEAKIITMSNEKIASQSIFQHHKTSHRAHYNRAYEKAEKNGFYDALFFNENDHLVEASRHNVFIKKDGEYFTPPLSAGALNGIQRQIFIHENAVTEINLSKSDLSNADEILLSNSVRGVVRVSLKR